MNEYQRITEAIQCPNCEGQGTVGWCDLDLGPNTSCTVQHTISHCETCGGSGVMPGLEYAELEVTIDGKPYEYIGFTRTGDIPWHRPPRIEPVT